MNRAKRKRIAIALAITSVLALTGCGKNSSNTTLPPVGYVPGTIGAGGCVPVSGQIPFTGTNNYYDSANIYAGQIPGMISQPSGTMVVGGGLTGGQFQGSGIDGMISMNILPMNQAYPGSYPTYPGYPTSGYLPSAGPSTININGSLTISPATLQQIQMQFGGGGYYPGYQPYPQPYPTVPMPAAPSQVCVSGIAMNMGHYNNKLYGGQVYLYLNNTQHGFILYW